MLRDIHMRNIHEMEEMKRAQEFSVQKLRESHETTQRLILQVQEMQEQMMHSMSDSGEFQEVELNLRDGLTFPVNQQLFQVHVLC